MQLTINYSVIFHGILLTTLFLFSCNRNTLKTQEKVSPLPFNIDCRNFEHTTGFGIDSQIGTVDCDGYIFNYEYGRYSSNRPISLCESFSKKFYSYYYSKFFEAIYVEEKVHDVLKDSIVIVEVVNKRFDKKYIVDCKPCMATAKLLFADKEFLFAFNPNEEILKNENSYNFSIVGIDKTYYKKTYISKEENMHGVYFAPNSNSSKSRLKNKLSVTIDTTLSNTLEQILMSIKLK